MALTLGVGLAVDSVSHYGVSVINGGQLGCDLDDTEVMLSGSVGPVTPGCIGWRTTWRAAVERIRPDVVGVLVGRWDVSDHLYQGQWVHVGDPAWDAHLVDELVQAADILSSTGAKVVFFTVPYVDPPNEAANGTPFPENDPSRMTIWNELLVQAAARRKGTVTVIDLNRLLDPSGVYQPVIDGITVRWTDGVHISKDGGIWLQPAILPTVASLGLEARAAAQAALHAR